MKKKLLILLFITLCSSIFSAQKLKIGVPENSPLAYRDEFGRYRGIYIEMMNEFAKAEKFEANYYYGTLEACLNELDKGKIDFIVGAAGNEERLGKYGLSEEKIVSDWGIFYSKKDKKIKRLFDYENKNIGIVRNNYFSDKIIGDFEKYNININLKEYTSYGEMAKAVLAGKIDFAVADRLQFIKEKGYYDLRQSGNEYYPSQVYFLTGNIKNKKFIKKGDDFIKVMKNDTKSLYAAFIEAVNKGDKKISGDDREILRILIIFAITFGFFIAAAAVIIVFMKYRKAKKQSQLCETKSIKIENKFYDFIDFYQRVIDAIPDPVYYTDTDGKCIGVNRAFQAFYTKKSDEIIGKRVNELFDIKDATFIENQKKLLTDGGFRSYEISNFPSESGPLTLRVYEETLYAKDLTIEGISGFIEDITEEKTKEIGTKKLEKNLYDYLDITDDIFLAIGKDGNIIMANKKCCEVLEYEREEMIGKNWFDSFVPDFIGSTMREAFSGLHDPEMEPEEYFEIPVFTKTGTEKKIGWKNYLLRDGDEITFISMGKDITERSVADKVINDSKNFLKAVLDVIPYSIAILDDTGKIIVVNKEWRVLSSEIMYKNFGVGVNYLERLFTNEDPNFPSAHEIAFGVSELLNKKKNKFVVEYDYDKKARIRIKGMVFEIDSKPRVVIIQENITETRRLF